MYIIMFIEVVAIAYISTFKDDFNQEHLDKAGPFIFLTLALFVIIGVVGSILVR